MVCMAENIKSFLLYHNSSEESMLSEELVEQDEKFPLPAKSIRFLGAIYKRLFMGLTHPHSGMMDIFGVHLTEIVVVSV